MAVAASSHRAHRAQAGRGDHLVVVVGTGTAVGRRRCFGATGRRSGYRVVRGPLAGVMPPSRELPFLRPDLSQVRCMKCERPSVPSYSRQQLCWRREQMGVPGMPRYVALLRGINLGSRNRVAMADLRQVVASLGHTEVITYIQSGNVIFTSPDDNPVRLAKDLEQEIAGQLAVQSPIVLLSREELACVISENPFPEETNPKCLHVVFRREAMGPDGIAAIAAAQQRARDKGSRDEAVVVGRTLFLRTPEGLGRSELAAQLARSSGQAAAGTARNWATVTRLMAMLGSAECR